MIKVLEDRFTDDDDIERTIESVIENFRQDKLSDSIVDIKHSSGNRRVYQVYVQVSVNDKYLDTTWASLKVKHLNDEFWSDLSDALSKAGLFEYVTIDKDDGDVRLTGYAEDEQSDNIDNK